MAEDRTFIFHKKWIDNIEGLELDLQDKILADMVRYGSGLPTQYDDISAIQSYVNFVKDGIDYSLTKYEEKKNGGKSRMKATDEQIWRMAQSGMSAEEIAAALGVKKNTVQHKEGWAERKNPNYLG